MFSGENEENMNMTKIDPKIVEQLLIGYKKPEDIIGENGLLKQLTKAVLERALQAELTGHLGYEKHDPAGKQQRELAERSDPEDADG
jgi:transposase-like protein